MASAQEMRKTSEKDTRKKQGSTNESKLWYTIRDYEMRAQLAARNVWSCDHGFESHIGYIYPFYSVQCSIDFYIILMPSPTNDWILGK